MARQPASTAARRTPVDPLPNAFAWQVHAALESGAAKADVKASIMLAFEGGAALLIVTYRDAVLAQPERWPIALAATALGLLVAAMTTSAGVILPMMGSRNHHRRDHLQHFVYFGHLRFWRHSELADRISRLTAAEELDMLARQLVHVSRINWRKHRLLQSSVVLTVTALCCIAVAALATFHRN